MRCRSLVAGLHVSLFTPATRYSSDQPQNTIPMPTVKYNVHMVSQQHSPVCWLACAAMLLQYKRRLTPNARMLGITDSTDFRAPQTVPEYGNAQWSHMRRLGMTNARIVELNLGVRSVCPEVIYEQLRQRGPFILHHMSGAFWYGPHRVAPASRGGHSVLVVGMDTVRGCMWFHNPWGETFDANVMTTTSSVVEAIREWERNPANKSITYM